jgi:hypothetical protein
MAQSPGSPSVSQLAMVGRSRILKIQGEHWKGRTFIKQSNKERNREIRRECSDCNLEVHKTHININTELQYIGEMEELGIPLPQLMGQSLLKVKSLSMMTQDLKNLHEEHMVSALHLDIRHECEFLNQIC